MRNLTKNFKVSKLDFYKTHFNVINVFLETKLTEKEIDILATFLNLDKNLTDDDMFNSFARKKVVSNLGITSAVLSNHLSKLQNKKIIEKHPVSKRLKIAASVVPQEESLTYTLIVNIDE